MSTEDELEPQPITCSGSIKIDLGSVPQAVSATDASEKEIA